MSIARLTNSSAGRPSTATAKLSRRQFVALNASVCLGAALPKSHAAKIGRDAGGYRGSLCFFSKHLPDMNYQQLARAVKRLGFDGVDLTVRKGGHVLPERAAQDLPKAAAAIRAEDLKLPMITTGLLSADDPTALPILSTAGKLEITYVKPGYYRYDLADVRGELAKTTEQFRRLVELAKACGVQVGYHNHASYVGAPVWDIAQMIEDLDPQWVGYYFDPRHAVAEGGVAAWKIALNLASRRLKMVALKDFYWEKTAGGWETRNCPLGEGMVDWKYFFKVLAEVDFHGPMSLHLEYDIPGSTPAAVEENTLAAAQRDLAFIQAHLREAYTNRVSGRL